MAELQELKAKAFCAGETIRLLQSQINIQKKQLGEYVVLYNKERIGLLLAELEKRGLGWCTQCNNVYPAGELEFIFVEGKEEYSCGYENSCYSFRNFSALHCACKKCCEKAYARSGSYGLYDTFTKDQTSFSVLPVEKRDDGYYLRQGGKLDVEKYPFPPKPPAEFIRSLAAEFKLPPEIEVGFNDKIIEV